MKRDTLVIIDDSELDLAILNEIFKRIFKVKCLSDVNQAIDFILHNHERICAVLLDICLGKKGAGFTVLEKIRHTKAISNLPIILITTDANEENVLDGVQHGAVDFLVKPVDPHLVQKRVCKQVESIWSNHITILGEGDETPDNRQAYISFLPDSLSLKDVENLSNQWLQKMTLLSQFRKGFSMEHYQKIHHLTTLLATTYVNNNKKSNFSHEDAIFIGFAATFHDIGLLGIPDEIIAAGKNQPESNRHLYFQHTDLGKSLFENDSTKHPFLRYCADIAYWHHKNYDGTGYPITAGEMTIPISAQLVRTALRCDFYVQSYISSSNFEESVLGALATEVNHIISQEMYTNVLQSKKMLFELISKLYISST